MKVSIFGYLDYRAYLRDLIGSLPAGGRGERKRMSEALGCQMAFITHVLGGEKDFSSEQALKIARHFHLTETEREYFLDLLSHNRAGTADLTSFYLHKLESQRRQHNLLQNRLEERKSLSAQDQAKYYSHWIYAAVHMAATIPALQSVAALCKHFGWPAEELRPVLEFLREKNLIEIEGGVITAGQAHIYVGADSPLVIQHHKNWRVKAMHDLASERPEDLHYSLCFSAAEKDWPLLRERILATINECLEIIRPSKEEKLGLFAIDFQGL